MKRVDLAIRAMAHAPPASRSSSRARARTREALEALADDARSRRSRPLLGEVGDDDSLELYAGALGVIFPPYDEDYGYVTLEAFLAHKPVITTTDAGGPNEFVVDGVNGFVVAPDPEAIGEAMAALASNRVAGRRDGRRRLRRARGRSRGTASSKRLVGD